MAHIRVHELQRRRNGKPVKVYRVIWREPVRDNFGLPVPRYAARPDGPPKTQTCTEKYPTLAEAEARRDELNAARHTTGTAALAEQRKAGELPFGHYARLWIDAQVMRVADGKLKQSTYDGYIGLLHRYVLDEFGAHAIGSITPAHCERFRARLVAQKSKQGADGIIGNVLSPGTRKHAWNVLRWVLAYAMRSHGAITSNPADATYNPGARAIGDARHFEHNPLTAEQIGRLSAAIAGEVPAMPGYPVYALLVEFAAYTGLRAAELAGLEVQDIVINTRPGASIRGTVRVQRTKDRRGKVWVTGTPKSKRSRRTVPLPAWLAERMATYLAETHPRGTEPTAPLWPSRKNGGGYRAKGRRYAVPLDWSQPLYMDTFFTTVFKPALVAVGLPASRPAITADDGTKIPAARGIRMHDLRHTFAVLQLSAGAHFMQVSKWLGRSTFTLTLNTYGDWVPEEDGGALNTLPEPPAPSAAQPTNLLQMRARQANYDFGVDVSGFPSGAALSARLWRGIALVFPRSNPLASASGPRFPLG